MSSTLAVLQQFSIASRIFPKQFIFSHFHIVVRIKPKLSTLTYQLQYNLAPALLSHIISYLLILSMLQLQWTSAFWKSKVMSVISVSTLGFPLPGILSPRLAYFYHSGLSSNAIYQWSIRWSVNKVVPSRIPSNMPFFVIAFIALAIYKIHFVYLIEKLHTHRKIILYLAHLKL